MTIEEALFEYVTTCPPIHALIENRFYPVVAPQADVLPLATYQRIDASRERAASGPTGAVEAVYNVSCWAKTYPEAKALARTLRNELDGAPGPWGDVEVGLVQADDTRDDFNGDLQLFGVLVTVRIQFREA